MVSDAVVCCLRDRIRVGGVELSVIMFVVSAIIASSGQDDLNAIRKPVSVASPALIGLEAPSLPRYLSALQVSTAFRNDIHDRKEGIAPVEG